MKYSVLTGLLAAVVVVFSQPAAADESQALRAKLEGFNEVPAVSSVANGRFNAKLDASAGMIEYTLSYAGLEGMAQQSHIHVGQRNVNGGISVFLCSNLGNGPAGTQACPQTAGTVTGTIRTSDVIGPAAQGISAGEFAELVQAIEAGAAYINVHTTKVPAGEIRGQIKSKDNKDD